MHKKILLILCVILVISVGVVLFFNLGRTTVNDNKITATVTAVIDSPNVAENGYYGITIKDDRGQEYTIDATGYLNTPQTPDSQGEACVRVPKVKIGDKITFNLPQSESQDKTFDICYKNNLSGYYFKVN